MATFIVTANTIPLEGFGNGSRRFIRPTRVPCLWPTRPLI